jgi:hypothetical protein
MPKPISAGDPQIALLLHIIDEGYDQKAWHGPNLRGSLRRVDAATAAFRPDPKRKTIWEHTVHAAYWKYAVRRRLTGEDRGSFPFKGSNWFTRPDCTVHVEDWEAAWKADLKLLDETHRQLRAIVVDFDPQLLDVIPKGSKLSNLRVIAGIALQDVYHAGQIALLKRLAVDHKKVG